MLIWELFFEQLLFLYPYPSQDGLRSCVSERGSPRQGAELRKTTLLMVSFHGTAQDQNAQRVSLQNSVHRRKRDAPQHFLVLHRFRPPSAAQRTLKRVRGHKAALRRKHTNTLHEDHAPAGIVRPIAPLGSLPLASLPPSSLPCERPCTLCLSPLQRPCKLPCLHKKLMEAKGTFSVGPSGSALFNQDPVDTSAQASIQRKQ